MWCVSLVFILELISNFGSLDGRCVLYIEVRCGRYAGACFENWPVRPMRPVRPVRGLYTPQNTYSDVRFARKEVGLK